MPTSIKDGFRFELFENENPWFSKKELTRVKNCILMNATFTTLEDLGEARMSQILGMRGITERSVRIIILVLQKHGVPHRFKLPKER